MPLICVGTRGPPFPPSMPPCCETRPPRSGRAHARRRCETPPDKARFPRKMQFAVMALFAGSPIGKKN